MARIFSLLASLVAGSAAFGSALPARAVDTPPVPPSGTTACLVGLGSGDAGPAWSQLDVRSNRSVDLDLAEGAGLTVACGTFVSAKSQPSPVITPAASTDPSTKGDFGSL